LVITVIGSGLSQKSALLIRLASHIVRDGTQASIEQPSHSELRNRALFEIATIADIKKT
jgi:hypothetical protein